MTLYALADVASGLSCGASSQVCTYLVKGVDDVLLFSSLLAVV